MRRGRNGLAGRSADARPTVLLTDGEERSVLAAARGLAAASYRVACAATSRSAATHWSRACDEQLLLPDVRSGVTAFVSSLEAVLDGGDYRVTIPGTDAALLVASASRARLERRTTIGLPSPEAVTAALDNLALLEGATAAGVETPESVVCRSLSEAVEAAAELGLPAIVKARSSVTREGDRVTHHRTMLVADVAGLRNAVGAAGFPCVVQGREDEPRLLSLAGVVGDDGALLAVAASRYLRTWPLQAGAAAFSETVTPPAGLVDAASTVLEALGWRGIFELEFLETRDGRTLLIDLNPRVYGSLALAVAAGINLPAVWCGHLLGERSTGLVLTARAGMRYRWEDADARNLLHFLRSGQLRTAVAVARPKRNVTHAFGRLDDPAPLAARAVEPLARRLRLRRARRRPSPLPAAGSRRGR
jgi:predicted ATP-grasp superfamily ATP-dependent carboligase